MVKDELNCITWNIHRAKGTDGRTDPARVMAALRTAIAPHGPDILALTEADTDCPPHAGILNMEDVCAETGLRYVHDHSGLRWGSQSHGFLGTILFVRPGYEITQADVIDLPGHCHRGAIVAELCIGGREIRVMSTHLSLTQVLRMAQMRVIGQYLRRATQMPTILLGDLNEWRPWRGLAFSRHLVGQHFKGPAVRTFPTRKPLLPLDGVLSTEAATVTHARAINAAETNRASDHRPLMARVVF